MGFIWVDLSCGILLEKEVINFLAYVAKDKRVHSCITNDTAGSRVVLVREVEQKSSMSEHSFNLSTVVVFMIPLTTSKTSILLPDQSSKK